MTGPLPFDLPSSAQHGTALLERVRRLAPDPTSAGEARRLLRAALEELERDDWIDIAELAISEVVTNASLHAHTPIDLRIGIYDDEVCVEVRDYNPMVPLPRNYEDEATTGRGMGLVAALARECGVHSLGDDGKVVWFCIGEPGPASAPESAIWELEGWEDPEEPAVESREVVLHSMPPALYLAARQHHDAILRELTLYFAGHESPGPDLASADRARSMISNALVLALGAHRGDGSAHDDALDWEPDPAQVPEHLDLRVDVPAEGTPLFVALQHALDTAERLATAGELLIPPGPAEIVAVRTWACRQVIAQLSGEAPTPWAGAARLPEGAS